MLITALDIVSNMNIDKNKAREILRALIYQEIVEESNKEKRGENFVIDKPITKEFVKFCGLTDNEVESLYEEVFEDLDEYKEFSFWDDFSEKIAIIRREEDAESKGFKFSQKEAFMKLCSYMDDVNERLEEVNQIELWKYIAQYFE